MYDGSSDLHCYRKSFPFRIHHKPLPCQTPPLNKIVNLTNNIITQLCDKCKKFFRNRGINCIFLERGFHIFVSQIENPLPFEIVIPNLFLPFFAIHKQFSTFDIVDEILFPIRFKLLVTFAEVFFKGDFGKILY